MIPSLKKDDHMAGVQEFSPYLFNHFYQLEKLMNGQDAISQIESAYKYSPSLPCRYFGRWRIIWITIKYPFELIASVVFKVLSAAAFYLDAQKASRFFYVLSRQTTRDWEQLVYQWKFNSKFEVKKDGSLLERSFASSPLLVPAFNAHQFTSWDYYAQDPVPLSFLTESRVKEMTSYAANYEHGVKQALKPLAYQTKEEKERITKTFQNKYANSPSDALQFLKREFRLNDKDKGIQKVYDMLKRMDVYLEKNFLNIPLFSHQQCRGASLWFIYLYLKTAEKCPDPHKHLFAVAEQFKTGIPKEGALLQSLERVESLLKVEKTSLKDHTISLYELNENRESALIKIQSLNQGIYQVGVLDHSLVYIKVGGQGYQWDPEYGLVACSPQQLLNLILFQYYQPSNPDSRIYFDQYRLRALR